MAIFDEYAESREHISEQLAKALSAKLKALALTMLLDDEGGGQVHLIAEGEIRDKYSNTPDPFGLVSAAERRAWKGVPLEWARAFGMPGLESKLKKAFAAEGPEETLGALVESLGINGELARSSHQDVDEIGAPPPDLSNLMSPSDGPFSRGTLRDLEQQRMELAAVHYERVKLVFVKT